MKVWSLNKVKNALPLVRAILMDIRERCIAGNALLLQIRRLDGKLGLPSRKEMVAIQNLKHEESDNDTALRESLTELQSLGAFCYDPICAVALFPFKRQQCYAWFVYSPFGNELFWRLDNDEMAIHRNVEELESYVERK